ncbi:MAG: BMP family protein [Treponema sp.]|jgi:basic membrane protein A|nr:BMP family protein [Treponema sp.]
MKKIYLFSVTLAFLFVLVLAGCKASSETQESGDFRVAIVLPGSISDAGWNAGGYLGAEYVNRNLEKVAAEYVENVSVTQAEAAFRDYAQRGYDLVIGWSFDFGDVLQKVAAEYPGVHFAWSQGYIQGENLATFSAPLQETAYLSGIIAASMTKTNTIGYVAAMETVSLINAFEGYKEGARFINPDIKILYSIVGSWSDIEKGRQAALAQIEQGADVLMARGDGISLGCIEAVKEKRVYIFGDVTDQNSLAPDLLLTSTVWNLGKNVEFMIRDIRAGTFANKAYSLGIRDGVTDISDYHGLVPDDVAAVVAEARDKLISGALVIEERTQLTD